MILLCASSWRSMSYMVESVRGIVEPIRVGTWCKPQSRCKVSTPGWDWASVSAIAFRKGKSEVMPYEGALLDHVTAAVVKNGRRAELPADVAQWAVAPYACPGRFLDPFAGSGALVKSASELGMVSIGYEKQSV